MTTASRFRLRMTTPMYDQSRVLPNQRAGLRCLAYAFRYRPFADVLTGTCERPRIDVVLYFFSAVDWHHRHLAGLPAHRQRPCQLPHLTAPPCLANRRAAKHGGATIQTTINSWNGALTARKQRFPTAVHRNCHGRIGSQSIAAFAAGFGAG
jgi:hypothetical protein